MNTIQIAKRSVRLPDFIIAGAMKCGTTSLHHILSHHTDIYMPSGEIHFYSIDDLFQHPGYFSYENGEWFGPDFELEKEKYFIWYSHFFEKADDDEIVGEDSTTYLPSQLVPGRIADTNPNAKIIIMLRDPASRSYSHYQHLVRTGRASNTFEKMNRGHYFTILQRSFYKSQIENYLQFFPREQLMFIVFEEFIKDTEKVYKDVCSFIGVDNRKMTLDQLDTHRNKAKFPLFLRPQLLKNKIFTATQERIRLKGSLPFTLPDHPVKSSFYKAFYKVYNALNPHSETSGTKMKKETRAFLNNYFRELNEGLNELCGREMDTNWYRND